MQSHWGRAAAKQDYSVKERFKYYGAQKAYTTATDWLRQCIRSEVGRTG